jgi:FkbM family methyltransferase
LRDGLEFLWTVLLRGFLYFNVFDEHSRAAELMKILGFAKGTLRKSFTYGRLGRLRHVSNFFAQKYQLIDIRGVGTVRVRPKSSDIWSFLQVFECGYYNLADFDQFPRIRAAYQRKLDAGRIPIIIDAGANVGAASIWFSKLFPKARIFAIEPDRDNAELCRLNTHMRGNIKVIEGAVGSEPGRVSQSNPEKQRWSIRTTRSSDGEVPIWTMSQIILEEGHPASLFLVKIDIEGFEDDLFVCNTAWLDGAEVVILEPHDYMFAGQGRSRNFQRELANRNFEILICGNNLVYVRLPNHSDAETNSLHHSPQE